MRLKRQISAGQIMGPLDVSFLKFLKNYFHRSIEYFFMFELNFCVSAITLICSITDYSIVLPFINLRTVVQN